MPGTWTEAYYARGQCVACGTIMWCSSPTDSVGCSINCGQATLHADGQGVNVAACDDAAHEQALRQEQRLDGVAVVLVYEGGA